MTSGVNLSSIDLHCHFDAILPVYNWLRRYFRSNNDVVIFKRKDFLRKQKHYLVKHNHIYTVVVATDEGDDYEETNGCLREYVDHINPQTKRLIYIGYDTVDLSPKIKKINVRYSIYSYFAELEKINIPKFKLGKIKKPGASLINRMTPERFKTFSSFLKYNLPMYMSVNAHTFTTRNTMTPEESAKIWHDPWSHHFDGVSINTLLQNIPYKNFNEPQSGKKDEFSYHYRFPTEVAKHSLFYLVNETYDRYFTEKTLIPFCFKKIGLVNNIGGIDRLKDAGFDVFDDIVDHSYQHIETLDHRQDAVLDEFRRVISNISDYNIKDIEHRLNINQEFLFGKLKDLFNQEQREILKYIKQDYNNIKSQ